MPKPKLYIHQGSLVSCLDVMGAMFKQTPDLYLSIIKNEVSKNYSLVDDNFLSAETNNPNEGQQRVLMRVTLNEYLIIVSWLKHREQKLNIR